MRSCVFGPPARPRGYPSRHRVEAGRRHSPVPRCGAPWRRRLAPSVIVLLVARFARRRRRSLRTRHGDCVTYCTRGTHTGGRPAGRGVCIDLLMPGVPGPTGKRCLRIRPAVARCRRRHVPLTSYTSVSIALSHTPLNPLTMSAVRMALKDR